MRDVANSNGFSASNLQTKNKGGMSSVTSSNSGTLTRADYRSYRDFLGSYGDNKNSIDDQESVSSTDSGISESKSNNTSTSSLNSEIGTNSKILKTEQNTGIASRTGSFRNYMEGYSNKKFSSVKANVVPTKPNIIKSEIVIQVNDPLEKRKKEPETIFVTTINGDDQGEYFVDLVPPPQNFLPPPLPNSLPPRATNNPQEEVTFFPPPPPPPPKLPDFSIPPPPPKLPPAATLLGKKWDIVQTEDQRPNSNPSQPEKRPGNHAAAASLAKILTQHLLPRRKELEALENDADVTDNKSGSIPSPPLNQVKCGLNIPPAPKLPEIGVEAIQKPKTYVSVMPKLPQYQKTPVNGETQKVTVAPKWAPMSPPALPKYPLKSAFPQKFENSTFPRQPKKISTELWENSAPKCENFAVPKQPYRIPAAPRLPPSSPPKTPSGRSSPSGSVDFNKMTVVPVTDGASKVSKSDPNVRKLVYNTYRGLLGAYNNKANDMIATLPRNRVREDQGISKQLESMALQGGLEKLNGRTNPNVEQE